MKTLEKTPAAKATTTGKPKPIVRSAPKSPRRDQRTLAVNIPIETHVALEKLAAESGETVEMLVFGILGHAANSVELASADFESMADAVEMAKSKPVVCPTEPKAIRKIRPVTVTIEGELAEKVRTGSREVGFRAEKWAAMLVKEGDLMSSSSDEAQEHRVQLALHTLQKAGFVCVRALPSAKERRTA